MRHLAIVPFLLLAACASGAEIPRPVRTTSNATTVEHTSIDHEDISLDLPGRWQERAIDDGYELRGGDDEQIIVALFPILRDLAATAAIEKLAQAQEDAMRSRCQRGAVVGAPERAKVPMEAIRFHFTCEEPRLVSTFVAAAGQGRVLSYQHYRYRATTLTPPIDRADAAILATLRIKPPASRCPAAVFAQAEAQGGACLEAAVLGEATVADCTHQLESRAWTRDDATAEAIGRQMGKRLVCYRRP